MAQKLIENGSTPPNNDTVVQFRMVEKRLRSGDVAVVERGQVRHHPNSMKMFTEQFKRLLRAR